MEIVAYKKLCHDASFVLLSSSIILQCLQPCFLALICQLTFNGVWILGDREESISQSLTGPSFENSLYRELVYDQSLGI